MTKSRSNEWPGERVAKIRPLLRSTFAHQRQAARRGLLAIFEEEGLHDVAELVRDVLRSCQMDASR